MFDNYNHEDFTVSKRLDAFGGFDKVIPKDSSSATRFHFFRKSVMPGREKDITDLLALQKMVMKEGCQGSIHPMYDYAGKRWVLMAVPTQFYDSTGIASLA
ncbi:hypothetical protein ONZ45_g4964 [Pleurotus djamor]|nr:hypothetical protein ONZ45_g4964 [Pleurotus djamor]